MKETSLLRFFTFLFARLFARLIAFLFASLFALLLALEFVAGLVADAIFGASLGFASSLVGAGALGAFGLAGLVADAVFAAFHFRAHRAVGAGARSRAFLYTFGLSFFALNRGGFGFVVASHQSQAKQDGNDKFFHVFKFL